jgi:hypothetical protein
MATVREQELIALQKAEYQAFKAEVQGMIDEFQAHQSLHKHISKVRTFIEKFLAMSVQALKNKEYKRFVKYNQVMERFLYALLEQSLREWIQLGERESSRPKLVELILSKDISVKDRILVRLGKFIKDSALLTPLEVEDHYFSKFIMFQLAIVINNRCCVDYVKGNADDALSSILKISETVDLFETKGYMDM